MKPILQALVLAERVYVLEDGRKAICGTFTGIKLKIGTEDDERPEYVRGGQSGAPWAYISLTGVCDNTELLLQFVSLKRNHVIFEQQITISGKNRLSTVELVCGLPHLHVSEAGIYAFDIVCEGEILGSYRIDIQFIDESGVQPEEA